MTKARPSRFTQAMLLLFLAQIPTAALADPRQPVSERIRRVEAGLRPGASVAGEPDRLMTLEQRMRELNVPGISVAVIQNGEIAWARAYGVRARGEADPVTETTMFQAASISKAVTAVAALTLAAGNSFGIDQPVNARLSAWRIPDSEFGRGDDVTLRRLLSHSAGLSVTGFRGYPVGEHIPAIEQILNGEEPANSEPVRIIIRPGSEWKYSGGGYTIVQELIEDLGGAPFSDVLDRLVLEPAGMQNSSFAPLPQDAHVDAAAGHDFEGNMVAGRWHSYPEKAAAGLWTTPGDLARFAIEIMRAGQGRPSAVSPQAAALLTQAQPGFGFGINRMGLGVAIAGSGEATRFWHSGGNRGYRSYFVAFPETGQGAAIMTNGDRGDILYRELVRSIAAEYEWPASFRRSYAVIDVPTENLAGLAGTYGWTAFSDMRLDIELAAGGLLGRSSDGREIRLRPHAPDRFFDPSDGTEYFFRRDEQGRPVELVITADNSTVVARPHRP